MPSKRSDRNHTFTIQKKPVARMSKKQKRDERKRAPESEACVDPVDADTDHGRARDYLGELPQAQRPQRDQDLRVLRLRQREVELAVAHLVDELLHVRLDRRVDDPAEQDL